MDNANYKLISPTSPNGKRKSGEFFENDENLPPQSNIAKCIELDANLKRSRSKNLTAYESQVLIDDKTLTTQTDLTTKDKGPKLRSALPRFQTKSRLSISRSPRIPTKSKQHIDEVQTDTTKDSKSNSILSKTIISTISSLSSTLSSNIQSTDVPVKNIDDCQDKVVMDAPTNKIKDTFDDSTLNTLEEVMKLFNIKTKSKWDMKEKVKKQETVLKEVKESLSKYIQSYQELKQTCLNISNSQLTTINDLNIRNQIQDKEIYELKSVLNQHQKDLKSSQQQLKETQYSIGTIQSDYNTYKIENSTLKQQIYDYQNQIQVLQSSLDNIQTQYDTLIISHNQMKFEYEGQENEWKMKYDQICDQFHKDINESKHHIQTLTHENQLLTQSKQDLEIQLKSQLESYQSLHMQLRDKENQCTYHMKDVDKYTLEITQYKEQIQAKDVDIRNTLQHMSEMQRINVEEKSTLRAEVTILQNRLQLLEEDRLKTTTQLSTKQDEVSMYLRDLTQYKESIQTYELKCKEYENELVSTRQIMTSLEIEKELRVRSEVREENERRERIAATAQAMAMETEYQHKLHLSEEMSKQKMMELSQQIDNLSHEKDNIYHKYQFTQDNNTALNQEIISLKMAIDQSDKEHNHESVKELSRITGELEMMKRKVKESVEFQELQVQSESKKIQEYEQKLQHSETMRRKLHNLVQELRGNIRVFARIRPFLPSDHITLEQQQQQVNRTIISNMETNHIRIQRLLLDDNKIEENNFNFDKVFGPSSSQEIIFQEVSEFVQSALDGYHVCLFSYGQTGSGKTHTMQGCGNGSMRGIIPRAMQQVGIYKQELETKGWEYKMEVTFIEIYNETIRDLLRTNNSNSTTTTTTAVASFSTSMNTTTTTTQSNDDTVCKHEIKRDIHNNTYITDITPQLIDPNNTKEIETIMEIASRHRSVGETAMNEVSSRSHSVFTLYLHATNPQQGITLKGTLSLVDLAGSERLDRSGVTGLQLKETVAINKSLSALTDVFVAIGNKQAHVPYRNSKLTYLLQPALSGDGKTLMMVNLSPTAQSYHESLCSLRLAKQVNQCELGKPKKHVIEATRNSNNSGNTNTVGNTSLKSISSDSNTTTGNQEMEISSSTSLSRSTCIKNNNHSTVGEKRNSQIIGNMSKSLSSTMGVTSKKSVNNVSKK